LRRSNTVEEEKRQDTATSKHSNEIAGQMEMRQQLE
jgi:hypothetical protein